MAWSNELVRDSLCVVIIDDNPDHQNLLKRALSDVSVCEALGGRPEVFTYSDAGEALTAMPPEGMVVTLCDHFMPGGTGMDWLPDLLKVDRGPVLLLSSETCDTVIAQAFKTGAADFLNKFDVLSHPDRLASAIRAAIRRHGLRQRNADLQRQLKLSNAELQAKNERLAELTDTAHRFVDDVAHEFRTPLTVVREFASLLTDQVVGPVNPEQIEMLRHVDQAVADLSTLIDDFLDTSKLRSRTLRVERRSVDLQEVLEPALAQVRFKAEQRALTLNVKLDGESRRVFCDPEKAKRALINLLTNAIKHSPDQGCIDVFCTAEATGYAIGVADRGQGLSAGQLDVISQRFGQINSAHQPKVDGFGLGLNIAHDLAWLNIGSIRVKTQLGEGSTFTLTLPRDDYACVVERFISRVVSRDPWQHMCSLIVDAGPMNGKALAHFITSQVAATDLAIPLRDGKVLLIGVTDKPHRWSERLEAAWIDGTDHHDNARPLAVEDVLLAPARLFAQQFSIAAYETDQAIDAKLAA